MFEDTMKKNDGGSSLLGTNRAAYEKCGIGPGGAEEADIDQLCSNSRNDSCSGEESAVQPYDPGSTNAARISQLKDKMTSFGREMENQGNQRRVAAESRIANLKEQINDVEDRMNKEVIRRAESSRIMQENLERQISDLTMKLQKTLDGRLEPIQALINDTNARVGELEIASTDAAENSKRRASDLDQRVADLVGDLSNIQHTFQKESLGFVQREANLTKQLLNLESSLTAKIHSERSTREEKMLELGKYLEDCLEKRRVDDQRLQLDVSTQVETLRKELLLEIQQREIADSDIVEALNSYIDMLHGVIRSTYRM